jgi:small subunit ribosomal protein S17
MSKIITGTIISVKMENTAVVEVVRRTPHPKYKKLLRRSKHLKADTNGKKVTVGDVVQIIETRPISKDKYFRLLDSKEGKKK